jgi:hypothetical protein
MWPGLDRHHLIGFVGIVVGHLPFAFSPPNLGFGGIVAPAAILSPDTAAPRSSKVGQLGAGLASFFGGAQKKYDIGATDTEIKIGNIMPYSGPASAYGVIGKTEQAYFNKINAEGGINGRKINFISYDDGYSPPKTVEQAPLGLTIPDGVMARADKVIE